MCVRACVHVRICMCVCVSASIRAHVLVCMCVHAHVHDTYLDIYDSVFLIRSYGVPNGAGRCSLAQKRDKAWATLAQH